MAQSRREATPRTPTKPQRAGRLCACFGFALCLAAGARAAAAQPAAAKPSRPNIVWLVGEDLGPDLGAYADAQARTPNLDALARQGAVFTRAFTHAPVCAPSRSGLITGMYPTTIGTHHMRSVLLKPPPLFTSYLKQAGYTIAWPGGGPNRTGGRGKTDFNFEVAADAFDHTEDWTQKLPQQPFFAYLNFPASHESQIRAPVEAFAKLTARLRPEERHDPAKAVVPSFYPDAAEVRRDIARYYDLVTAVDYEVGDVLAALERAGLADNTIVVFFGDHGRGLPRYKRWLYDTGIRVPLIVRWPGRVAAGSLRDDLVAFVDLAPTMLAAAGVAIPPALQGQDFFAASRRRRRHVFAARDRMDETYDRIRAVRGDRFKYIRNFHPELPYAQRIAYAELMPTLQLWRRYDALGRLVHAQRHFFAARKPEEELYDTANDEYEVNNLAGSPEHQAVLRDLRGALDRWMRETNDLGAVPETELVRRELVKDMTEQYRARKQ
jgi:uncharacterized sulfatase